MPPPGSPGAVVVVLASLLGAAAAAQAAGSMAPPMMSQWSTLPSGQLAFDFYNHSCPRAEEIIREAVRNATTVDPGLGAGLIRLAFHDCFVQGCDASLLLDPTPANPRPEKVGFPNLRGFEVLDAAKAAVEKACPGVVSCADVVQYAARDAALFLSRGASHVISYRLPGGRLDGRVSREHEAVSLIPNSTNTLSEIARSFQAKGIHTADVIVLLGAHSVGRAHCGSFSDRISPAAPHSDLDMDWKLAAKLRARCPPAANASDSEGPTVPLDAVTPDTLDEQYYKNLVANKALFSSDASLLTTWNTAKRVVDNAFIRARWNRYFERSMRRMAAIEIKTAANGEIRKNCRVVNN